MVLNFWVELFFKGAGMSLGQSKQKKTKIKSTWWLRKVYTAEKCELPKASLNVNDDGDVVSISFKICKI